MAKRARAAAGFQPNAHGGSRQRVASAAAAAERAAPPKQVSALVGLLLTLWCWGSISATTVQQIAEAVETDIRLAREGTLDDRGISKMASLGCHGQYTQNCYAELMRAIQCPLWPSVATFTVPLKQHLRSAAICFRDQAIILPHSLFACMYQEYREGFTERVLGGAGRIEQFWSEARHSPMFQRHPVRRRANYSNLAVPLSMHGDGTPITGVGKWWGKLANCYSWCSVLGHGSTLDLHFYIYSVMERLETKVAPGTVNVIWQIIRWSLHWLALGKWPDRSWNGEVYPPGSADAERAGKDLANGFFGVLWALRGDLDYYSKVLDLTHYAAASCCIWCRANLDLHSPLCWSEFREAFCQWKNNEWSASNWLAGHPTHCVIFDLDGVSIDTVFADWMHVKHLGTDMYVFGSVLFMLCFTILGGSPDANVEKVFERLQAYWQAHPSTSTTKYQQLSIAMFCKTRTPYAQFPKLRGRAAEVKSLGPALLHVWSESMNPASTQHRQIRLLLKTSCRLEDMLDEHRELVCYPEPIAREFEGHTWSYCRLLNALSADFASSGQRLFDLTIKAHMLIHCARQSRNLNPRMTWCYSGEDFMHKIRTLAGSCLVGTKPWKYGTKFVKQYLVGLAMRLTDVHSVFRH